MANLLIREMPEQERPRERLVANGAEALRNAELIAILLRTGMKGISAVNIADQLLLKFGTLENLARASLDDIRKVKGIGRDKAIALKSAFTLAQRMAKEGVEVSYREYGDMVHGFILFGGVLETANAAVAECGAKLRNAFAGVTA